MNGSRAKKTCLGLALCAWLLVAPGCATVLQAMNGGNGIGVEGPAMFGGTRSIVATWMDVAHGVKVEELSLVICAIDWITSLVGDTLILPWSIVNEAVLESFPMDVKPFHVMFEK